MRLSVYGDNNEFVGKVDIYVNGRKATGVVVLDTDEGWALMHTTDPPNIADVKAGRMILERGIVLVSQKA
jgi:hypothetical protein